jgi:hypothetical protein
VKGIRLTIFGVLVPGQDEDQAQADLESVEDDLIQPIQPASQDQTLSAYHSFIHPVESFARGEGGGKANEPSNQR